ncbi:PX domain-containing protein [Caenorhabditis elegans]|nr:PX domain-containing protein [Caenorhabditis elegans]CDR32780.1 PX domain-containing protein [Caenorhabditis elegans]|eukprot:NP_001293997.1 Sorting nexin lst-4 [Caenorhabditis elegans]
MNNGIIQWKPIQQYYTCIVDKPKKESKLKGLKSFIAYSITSSLTNIQVSRRYKHFDWLHEQLSAKYVLIPIPPLPEKQVAGRYEEDLIDHRKHILQLWVNKICRHPVLSQSEVWLHFISCTDEKDWKNGKRRAEKDEYIGGAFLNCITVPHQPLDPNNVDMQVERFQRSVKTSEEAMRVMQERMNMFQKVFAGPVKQNWQKMGSAFKTLQQSFEIDETVASRRLTEALAYTASEYHEIGQVFDAHTKNDMEPVLENLYSYKGTVQNVPDIIQVHKQAVQKFRDSEGRLSSAEAEKMKQRIDAMSYTVIAEVQHQTAEKVEDMKSTMGTYLKKQAMFYQEVATKLTSLAARYD